MKSEKLPSWALLSVEMIDFSLPKVPAECQAVPMAASSVSPEKGPEEICYYKPLPQEPMGRWRIWRICEGY